MASMMMLVSSRKVAMSAGGYFFEPALALLAQFPDPLRRTLLQFGVVLVLPGAGRGLESLDLASAHELLLGRFGQEVAALARADQPVDVLDQLLSENDAGAFGGIHGT
jgi:hypothetical protein